MGHESTYEAADPLLQRLRVLALGFPEATEVEAWGRPTFRVGKMFAIFGASPADRRSVIFKPDPLERAGLEADARFYVPAYFKTWLALDLDDGTDWAEVEELLDSSYRQVAPKRLLERLDS